MMIGGLFGIVFILFPKAFTGDYADITIENVTSTPGGKVTIRFASVASYGTPVSVQLFKERKYVSGTRDESRGSLLRRPVGRERVVSFNLDPEGTATSEHFEDSPLFKRLLVKAGTVYHLHGEQTLTLFDFMAADGARYTGFIRVGASLSGI
ncbi:MAG TPA: hypothetical protein VHC44_11395 [Verrucomicrobiae bacterium]|nr:hypothetical protein [Verrucomicrobiae bacterium]